MCPAAAYFIILLCLTPDNFTHQGEIQALKYRSVTDIVRPIREIVRRREETTGHSVRPK
jgi:hypothetical protein